MSHGKIFGTLLRAGALGEALLKKKAMTPAIKIEKRYIEKQVSIEKLSALRKKHDPLNVSQRMDEVHLKDVKKTKQVGRTVAECVKAYDLNQQPSGSHSPQDDLYTPPKSNVKTIYNFNSQTKPIIWPENKKNNNSENKDNKPKIEFLPF